MEIHSIRAKGPFLLSFEQGSFPVFLGRGPGRRPRLLLPKVPLESYDLLIFTIQHDIMFDVLEYDI